VRLQWGCSESSHEVCFLLRLLTRGQASGAPAHGPHPFPWPPHRLPKFCPKLMWQAAGAPALPPRLTGMACHGCTGFFEGKDGAWSTRGWAQPRGGGVRGGSLTSQARQDPLRGSSLGPSPGLPPPRTPKRRQQRPCRGAGPTQAARSEAEDQQGSPRSTPPAPGGLTAMSQDRMLARGALAAGACRTGENCP